MKDYRERRNCRWKKSLNDLAGRSGITFSPPPRRQGKARLDRKVVVGLKVRIRGNVRDVRTYIENLEKYSWNSAKTDVDDRSWWMHTPLPPLALCILGLAASPRVWLCEKECIASECHLRVSRAILHQWHGSEYRLFSSVKYAWATPAMARCRDAVANIIEFLISKTREGGILSERFVRDSKVFPVREVRRVRRELFDKITRMQCCREELLNVHRSPKSSIFYIFIKYKQHLMTKV